MLQVWNVSSGFCFQAIHRGGCGDVKRVVLRVAPSQIRRLLGHDYGAKMISIRVPDPDALRSSHEEISLVVDFDAVWNALMLSSGLYPKNASGTEASISGHIVYANVAQLAVVDIKLFA